MAKLTKTQERFNIEVDRMHCQINDCKQRGKIKDSDERVPAIFFIKQSARKFFVGWHFVLRSVKVGDKDELGIDGVCEYIFVDSK